MAAEPGPTYEYFRDKLLGPFEAFVQDSHVNLYLQTIGSEVTRMDPSTGFLREITVVTGYEDVRGLWATACENQIRFGNEILPVAGLRRAMVLTPNFFEGRNGKGFPVEYRLGMIPGYNRLYLHPVILRESEDGFFARILPDLCVIHNGIVLDYTGAELSRLDVARFTSYQQFLTCMWNIDDYLRKQNPHFDGEFPEVWRAIEAFSGRIVNQILLTVAFHCRAEPHWFIPEAEKAHLDGLLALIRAAYDESCPVNHNQVLRQVRNLNCYMTYFRNYWPLYTLQNDQINIAPHALELFLQETSTGGLIDEIKCEAVTVLIQMAKKTPKPLRALVPRFNKWFSDPQARVENPLMYLMSVMVRQWPEDFSEAAIRTYIEFLFRTFFRFRKLESYNYCRFFPEDVGETIYEALLSIVKRYPTLKPKIYGATANFLTNSNRLLSRFASPLLIKCKDM